MQDGNEKLVTRDERTSVIDAITDDENGNCPRCGTQLPPGHGWIRCIWCGHGQQK